MPFGLNSPTLRLRPKRAFLRRRIRGAAPLGAQTSAELRTKHPRARRKGALSATRWGRGLPPRSGRSAREAGRGHPAAVAHGPRDHPASVVDAELRKRHLRAQFEGALSATQRASGPPAAIRRPRAGSGAQPPRGRLAAASHGRAAVAHPWSALSCGESTFAPGLRVFSPQLRGDKTTGGCRRSAAGQGSAHSRPLF